MKNNISSFESQYTAETQEKFSLPPRIYPGSQSFLFGNHWVWNHSHRFNHANLLRFGWFISITGCPPEGKCLAKGDIPLYQSKNCGEKFFPGGKQVALNITRGIIRKSWGCSFAVDQRLFDRWRQFPLSGIHTSIILSKFTKTVTSGYWSVRSLYISLVCRCCSKRQNCHLRPHPNTVTENSSVRMTRLDEQAVVLVCNFLS